MLRFVFVGYKLLGIAWAYGDLRVFCGGTIAIVMMSLLNILGGPRGGGGGGAEG